MFDAERRARAQPWGQQAGAGRSTASASTKAEHALRVRMTLSQTRASFSASSLDYETTLAQLARLAVPEMATWRSADILAPNGSIQRLAVAHEDTGNRALVGRAALVGGGVSARPRPADGRPESRDPDLMTAEFVSARSRDRASLRRGLAQGERARSLLEIVRELGLRSAHHRSA